MAARSGLYPPDRIQRYLQLEESAARGEDESRATDRGGENARATLAGALEKTLHGERSLAPDEVIELAHNLAAHGLGTEHHAGDRCGDEQYRGDRKQRVVGQRRAETGAVIVPPGPGCGSGQSQDLGLAHESQVFRAGSQAAVQFRTFAVAIARYIRVVA